MRERALRETVLAVLRHHGIDVSESVDKGRTKYILSKEEVIEVHFLPDYVPRHLLGRFAVKFGFSMGDFFEEDLLSKLDEPQVRLH